MQKLFCILLALAAAIVLAVIGGEKPLEIADENKREAKLKTALTMLREISPAVGKNGRPDKESQILFA